MVDHTDLQAKIKVLSDAYAAQLPDKLEQIDLTWRQLPFSRWDEDKFQTLYLLVHNLSGSGTTFGFSSVSDVAHSLEEYLKVLAQAKTVLGEEQQKCVQDLLEELHRVVVR